MRRPWPTGGAVAPKTNGQSSSKDANSGEWAVTARSANCLTVYTTMEGAENILHNNRHFPDLSSTLVPSSTVQILLEYSYSQTCIYLQGSSGEIQTPTHLIGPNITTPEPVLSPSSILPPSSAHCDFHSRKKNQRIFKKCYYVFHFGLFLNIA